MRVTISNIFLKCSLIYFTTIPPMTVIIAYNPTSAMNKYIEIVFSKSIFYCRIPRKYFFPKIESRTLAWKLPIIKKKES